MYVVVRKKCITTLSRNNENSNIRIMSVNCERRKIFWKKKLRKCKKKCWYCKQQFKKFEN